MAQDASTQKLTADYEAVTAQLAALRDDLGKLAQTMTKVTANRGQALARDASDGMNHAMDYVGRKGVEADQRIESAVAANPYMALAIAAGVGVLFGAMTRR